MEGRLQAFTGGSSPATVDAQVVGTTGSIHFSSLSPPALLSPSYSLASKNTSSNKRANIFIFYSLSISETKRLGKKNASFQGRKATTSFSTSPSIYHRTRGKEVGRHSW